MAHSIGLFLEKRIEEKDVIEELNKALPRLVESLEFRDDRALFFLTFLDYPEGFASYTGIDWREDPSVDVSVLSVAQSMARAFSCRVLFEGVQDPKTRYTEWILVDVDGQFGPTEIQELDDGVTVL
ncbi:MAG: hypothetical protein F9K24_04705 [Leptonema illini]|jgi:hypothetical protein|uniref:Uncharacterized protein n=1 Tax=Leptonema illini TaxID=183 RepID=A0A833H4E2_9LEPT|nr:MAG: hypothetical protein F9K24_04705 [Leptonema illini]